MRLIGIITASTLLLAGCGAHGGVNAPLAQKRAAYGAQSTGKFIQVLRHEREIQETLTREMGAWAKRERLVLPMEPGNQPREVKGAHAGAMASRAMAGGAREVVGHVTFSWHREHSFEHYQTTRAFRLILQADGTIRNVKLEGKQVEGVPIVKPVFAKVDAAEAEQLMGSVKAFLFEPEQAAWIERDFLWAAVAGVGVKHTFELEEVRATAGAFSSFGRVIRYRGTLKREGRPVAGYTDTEMEAVMDRAGRVFTAGDTSW